MVFVFIFLFTLFQILIPLSHFIIPGNVSWTEERHDFSWHMKLRDKDIQEFEFYTIQNGEKITFPLNDLIDRQINTMIKRPFMIMQYVNHLVEKENPPNIHVRSIISLNHLRTGPLINESIDLSKENYKLFSHNRWINFQPK